MKYDMYKYERELGKRGYEFICGVDESGRGPLAGPLFVAAVILPLGKKYKYINDSKLLNEKKRKLAYEEVVTNALSISVSVATVDEIDKYNIYQSTKMKMINSIKTLEIKPDFVLIDAMNIEEIQNKLSLIKGDRKSISIAAASVVAKVKRDEYMLHLDEKYPMYNFQKNKGYPTKEHKMLLKQFGPCNEHRKSFKPVKDLLLE
jgi:ribonuclease HII